MRKCCSEMKNRQKLIQLRIKEDVVAKQILNEHKMLVDDRNPIRVSGDGNCLFNALSMDITGNKSLSLMLRVLTCIELMTNKHKYDTNSNQLKRNPTQILII